jgi:multicomponent Na+:H+ antiporter subunit C
MSVDWSGFLHYGLLTVLTLTGFHALLIHDHLLKKAAAWVVFQSGLLLLFLSLAGGDKRSVSSGGLNPFPHALALTVLIVSLAVVMVLLLLCAGLWKKYGTLQPDEIAKRMGS